MKESTRTLVLALLCALVMTACEQPAEQATAPADSGLGQAISGIKSENETKDAAQAASVASTAPAIESGLGDAIQGIKSESATQQ